uniref:Uncharacterized protein n=1 Tax=Setaria viridis TaxID=4556 RepID=A0A4U6U0K6_SETVI|nr:hypothetical protein SEVIR_7G314825v2 [Setaria viridis]
MLKWAICMFVHMPDALGFSPLTCLLLELMSS